MRLTVATYSFEAIPLEGTFAICKSIGFKGVVIAGFHNRGKASYEPDEVGANPQKFADHLNALLDKYELEAVDFFPQFALNFYDRALNHPNPDIRKKNFDSFRGIVRFCELTHIPGVTILPGAPFLERTQEQNLQLCGEMLKQCVEIAGEKGIHVYFEPHLESVCDKPELALRMIESAPGVKVALDYSHFVVQYVAVERVHPLLPHTGTFHIRQARPGKVQTRYNEGTIDFVDIIKRLQAVGYSDCLTVEYVCADWYGANEADTLNETVVTKAALESYVPV
jgi:sugar phosphate isomerase/epimerase